VTVLGAGHGGLALAGYLSKSGHRVTLWNRSPRRVAAVAGLGGIRLTLPGRAEAFAPVAVADRLGAALSAASVVLVAVPATAHADIARACAAHLRDGQTVLLLPGRTGGALEFRRVLRQAGGRARILLGEANTFPFASRAIGPAAAVIHGTKSEVRAAALPADRTPALVASCRPFLPMLAPAGSVLHTGFANVGAVLHPVITLLNAGRIEDGGAFAFYADGVTPGVASALAAADAERLRVAAAYGVIAAPLPEWVASAYGHRADTVRAAVGGNPSYAGIRAPAVLDHRYLWEDVPTGLIPLAELARAAGVPTPTLRSLVELARVVLGGEAWPRPRTLEALGLRGLTVDEIRALIEDGVIPSSKGVAAALGRFGQGLELVPQL
jgi:opine dehydrogenase